jgi:hypothetical protein
MFSLAAVTWKGTYSRQRIHDQVSVCSEKSSPSISPVVQSTEASLDDAYFLGVFRNVFTISRFLLLRFTAVEDSTDTFSGEYAVGKLTLYLACILRYECILIVCKQQVELSSTKFAKILWRLVEGGIDVAYFSKRGLARNHEMQRILVNG